MFDIRTQHSNLQAYPFDFTEFPIFYQRTHVGCGEDPCVSGEI